MKGNRREREAGGRTLMKMNKLIVFATVGFAAVAGFAAEQSDARGKSAAEAYRTVRDESEQLVENLSAAAEDLPLGSVASSVCLVSAFRCCSLRMARSYTCSHGQSRDPRIQGAAIAA